MSYKFLSTILGIDANFTGNVGVGTTTPTYKLTVQDTTNTGTIAIGNVTYPGLIFSSASTGEFRIDNRASSGAGYITFYPNGQGASIGTESMRITASGNVGIGTTNPATKLDVVGDTKITGATSTGNYSLSVYNSSNAISFYVRGFGDALLAGTLFLGAQNGPNFISNGTLGITSSQGTGNQFVRFTHNNGNNAFRILSNSVIELNPSAGNVLIGTTTDAGFKLDVNGTSMFRGVTQHNSDVALNGNRLYIGSHLGNQVLRPISTTNLQLFNSNSGATLFLDANGAVQIGQSNAVTWAYFTASGSTLYNTTTLPSLAGTGTRMVVADATGILSTQAVPTGTVTGSGTTNYISKWTSSSALGNSLVYDNGTNVGIGTTTPYTKLELQGPANNYSNSASVTFTDSSFLSDSRRWLIGNVATNFGSLNIAVSSTNFDNPTNPVMTFTKEGNVGVGTTSPTNFIPFGYGPNIDVSGGRGGGFVSSDSSGSYKMTMSVDSVSNLGQLKTLGNFPLMFGVNDIERFRITTGGNVLIGTTTDNGDKLQVTGNTTLGIGANRPVRYDSNGGSFRIKANPGGWATGYFFDGSAGTFRGGFGSYGDYDSLIYYWIGSDYNIPTLMAQPNQGNVGIGTTSPSQKLSVDSSGYSIVASYDAGNRRVYMGLDASGEPAIQATLSNGTARQLNLNSNGGNVLIGTTTDAGYKLQVNGSLYWGNPSGEYMYAGGSGHKFAHSTSTGNWLYSGGSTGLRINNAADTLNLVLITDGGNVGIGTTTPQAYSGYKTLEIESTTGGVLRLKNSASTGILETVTNSSETYIKNVTNTDLWLGTNNTERIRITSDGNVGIGTSAPGFATAGRHILSINGSSSSLLEFQVGGSFQSYIYNNGSDFEFYSSNQFNFNTAGVNRLKIANTTGNVLIGTTTDAGYKLDVNGTQAIRGSLSIINNSAYQYFQRNNNSYSSAILFQTSSTFDWFIGQNPLGTSTSDFSIYSYGTSSVVLNIARSTGVATLSSLSGTGTRMVVADSSGTLSTQAIPGGGSANGSWQDNNTQTAASNLTGYGVEFSTLNFRTGINVIQDTGSKFTLIQMTNAGRYNIQFSFQFQNTSSSAHDVYVWFRKNGETTADDIPNSNTLISVPAKHGSGTPGHIVAAWNFFVEAAPMDYYQIAWATDDNTSVTMEYYSPTGFCPGTPSAILTVNQVD